MKIRTIFFAALLAAVVLASGCTQPSGDGGNLTFREEWKNCQADYDCVVTQKGCCPCTSGGAQVGINQDYLSLWNEERAEKCGDMACPMVYACQPGRAVCDSGKCKFITAKDLCQRLCQEVLEDGMPLENGPCISDLNWTKWDVDDWVCDVAHSPRQAVDNQPENQCETFRSGNARHFVEVGPECNFLREV